MEWKEMVEEEEGVDVGERKKSEGKSKKNKEMKNRTVKSNTKNSMLGNLDDQAY